MLKLKEVNTILKKSAPYSDIFKLPELLDKFINLYGNLLDDMLNPVNAAISEARKRVFDELEGKRCQEMLSDKFIRLFQEIREKAQSCNNVATLQNIKVEADALKVRCLNEISFEEAKLLNSNPVNPNGEKARPVKNSKTISIKSLNTSATWQIETEQDVKRYVSELEEKLINSLVENTIINIEF